MEEWENLDPNVAHILHHAERINQAGSSNSVAPTSVISANVAAHRLPQTAPDLPNDLAEKVAGKALRLEARLRRTLNDPTLDPAEELIRRADEWAKTIESLESPLTQRARVRTLADWGAFMTVTDKTLPSNRHWDKDIVKANAVRFLYSKVENTDARPNKKTIKSRTVTWWCGLFLHAIATYAREPETNNKCGLNILINGLYKELKDATGHIIRSHKLDRHADVRIHIGRHELQMIISCILDATRTSGRIVALQHIIRWLIAFFFTTRASSLGATDKKWRELDYVPLCGDLRIFVRGIMDMYMDFRLRHFKTSISSNVGTEQTVRIDGVLFAHNAMFDLTVPTLAHLYLMGAFKIKFKSIEELFAFSGGELEIDPAFADTPLFREATPGGHDFASPPKAAMSRSAYDGLAHWAGEAGLPRIGWGCLRRDSGNLFGLQMGRKTAEDALHHRTRGPFRPAYSLNLLNVDSVPVRLGEKAGTKESVAGEKIKEHEERHLFQSYAVEAMVRRAHEDPDAKQHSLEARKQFKRDLQEKEPLKTFDLARTTSWQIYRGHFPAKAKEYSMQTDSARKMYKIASGETVLKKPGRVPLVFVKSKAAAANARDAFINDQEKFLACRKDLVRQHDRTEKNVQNWELRNGPLSGTAEERNTIMKVLTTPNPSEHIRQAVADALALAKAPSTTDQQSVQGWASALGMAQIATAILEAEDDPDAHEEYGDHDRLISYFDRMTMDEPSSLLAPTKTTGKGKATTTNDPKGKGKTSNESDDDDDDNSLPEGLDVDESTEEDILNIPIADVRKDLFAYYVEPVLTARAYEKLKVNEAEVAAGAEPGYKCLRCQLYVHNLPKKMTFLSIAHLERHLRSKHSEWKELELKIVTLAADGATTYTCPAGDYTEGDPGPFPLRYLRCCSPSSPAQAGSPRRFA
ncbi:hypothetical protein C8R43DRAFT_493005 [Mycena crocata]|nr:hypothetical protein C8R43DRAFT_493005 [Mycena crocata]